MPHMLIFTINRDKQRRDHVSSIFPCIGITGKRGDSTLGELLQPLHAHLQAAGIELLVDEKMADFLPDSRQMPLNQLAETANLVIVVGGDGTLLHSGRTLAPYNVPVVGINRGRLGFLADISPQEMLDSLDRILAGSYEEDPRFLLQAEIRDQDGQVLDSAHALNDVVFHKWNTARIIEFELRIDNNFVETQRSDGIIVSTPTGSTAYALSGGGPLIMPSLGAILLVPICPHTMSNRPIVVGDTSLIEIRSCGRTPTEHVCITCDGQTHLGIKEDQTLAISRASHPVRLIHPSGHDHFQILREKLGWGHNRT